MAEAIMSFSIIKAHFQSPSSETRKQDFSPAGTRSLKQCWSSKIFNGWQQADDSKRRSSLCKVNSLPDWPLMAVLVQHGEGIKDIVTHKSVWHLSDQEIKNIYTLYIMFTVWGCLFFGSMKDPYYDSELYRGDGGDGTGHWIYDKQEEIEEANRAALWREELIEEIEQKVGGLKELEAPSKEEELVK